MKKVTLTVEITLDIPDDVEHDLLHLDNKLEDFIVAESGCHIPEINVTGYTTVNVIEDSEIPPAPFMEDFV